MLSYMFGLETRGAEFQFIKTRQRFRSLKSYLITEYTIKLVISELITISVYNRDKTKSRLGSSQGQGFSP